MKTNPSLQPGGETLATLSPRELPPNSQPRSRPSLFTRLRRLLFVPGDTLQGEARGNSAPSRKNAAEDYDIIQLT